VSDGAISLPWPRGEKPSSPVFECGGSVASVEPSRPSLHTLREIEVAKACACDWTPTTRSLENGGGEKAHLLQNSTFVPLMICGVT